MRGQKSIFCLAMSLLLSADSFADEAIRNSVWIKLVDQEGDPIVNADVFYCDGDCTHAKRQTISNNEGLAELVVSGSDLTIQGIKKQAYDVRLQTLPYDEIRLMGKGSDTQRIDKRYNYTRSIYVRYWQVLPYSLPASEPLFILRGWKLGIKTCLEQGHKFIHHQRSEKFWNISNARYFYKIGDGSNTLREGGKDDYDFKITINRKRYPWANVLYTITTKYQMKIEFRNGGLLPVERSQYIHLAPEGGYRKKIVLKYTWDDVTTSHSMKYFIKVNNRYGALNLHVSPTEEVMFDYLLNREQAQRQLNIPSYFEERGQPSDYFACASSASVYPPQVTPPGACAKLGLRRIGC